MNIQTAIENITYFSKKFPAEEFKYISEHPNEALPYLHSAIDYVLENHDNIEEDYQLYFYALFFLAEFQDRESFARIVALSSLHTDTVDYLLGDAITENFGDILYCTYDGQLNLLKDAILNPDINEYVRDKMLDVMGQLYLDGSLGKTELQDFLKKLLRQDDMGEVVYTFAAATICNCHLIELLPEIQRLFYECLIEPMIFGEYEDFVDMMFEYSTYYSSFCKPVDTSKLKNWAMFEQDEENAPKKRVDESDIFDELFDTDNIMPAQKTTSKRKVGRNDPCPCGSGKKYKHCCLNKYNNTVYTVETIETEKERKKCLEHYPEIPTDKVEGHIYLNDYFDDDSIEIDRYIYLGLKHRPVPMWKKTPELMEYNENRKKYIY